MTFPASVKKCHCGKSDARRGDLLTVRNDVYTSGLFDSQQSRMRKHPGLRIAEKVHIYAEVLIFPGNVPGA